MIIFGWGHQMRKKLGPVFKHHCDHCNNEDYWILHKISVWFTLFFIPVFPYERNFLLLCPICTYGIKLDSNQFKQFAPIALNNNALIEGRITEEQYNEEMKLLSSGAEEAEVIEAKAEDIEPREKTKSKKKPVPNADAFCTECGSKVAGKGKFCAQCGSSLT